MRKIILVFTLMFGLLAQAQRNKQEVTADLADALVMKTLELGYEYYLSDQSSVGLSVLFNFEKRSADFRYNEKNMFTPFFRHYFTANQNWNYFGEAFLGINSGEEEIEGQIGLGGVTPTTYKDYTDGALGVGIGTKYISNGGFVISALAGIGRNMFTDNSPKIVPRIGFNLGYRF